MDVINVIVQNSALNGMPNWYKTTTLLLFSVIVTFLLIMLVTLLTYGPHMNIRFGYWPGLSLFSGSVISLLPVKCTLPLHYNFVVSN